MKTRQQILLARQAASFVASLPVCDAVSLPFQKYAQMETYSFIWLGFALGVVVPRQWFFNYLKSHSTGAPPADVVELHARLGMSVAFGACKEVFRSTGKWPDQFPEEGLATILLDDDTGSIGLHFVSPEEQSGTLAVEGVVLETDYFVRKGSSKIEKWVFDKDGLLMNLSGHYYRLPKPEVSATEERE